MISSNICTYSIRRVLIEVIDFIESTYIKYLTNRWTDKKIMISKQRLVIEKSILIVLR